MTMLEAKKKRWVIEKLKKEEKEKQRNLAVGEKFPKRNFEDRKIID